MRKALGFAGRFALAYALFVLLWVTGLERRYNDAIAAACRGLVARLEEPRLTIDVRRSGNLLVVQHVPHFGSLAPQEIVTRRVHSNTALFVALTLATPAGRGARALALAGGGVLLAASHVAHVIAYVEWHYALHNVGPYFTTVPLDQLGRLGLADLWARPAAWRRELTLVVASVFNVVLQRVVPILLWLPLFAGTLRRRGTAEAAMRRITPILAASAIAVAAALAVAQLSRTPAPEEIEGVRLGTSAIVAKRGLEERGYDWTVSVRRPGSVRGVPTAFIDVWPRRGPLTELRYGSRYNWIGLRLAQPPDRPPRLASACVTGLVTAPSDVRVERFVLLPGDPGAACQRYWASLEPAP
jgi:hypothetical protein